MIPVTLDFLTSQINQADALQAGRSTMFEPQDLPGRFGRVVKAVDKILASLNCEGVLGGGWAVWRHGYVGRVTQDLDLVLSADRVDDFLRVASFSGFEVLPISTGNWPKLLHKETAIEVDLLPEGGRPGTDSRPAPTTIPHPRTLRGTPGRLNYIPLVSLIELKLAAGRARDESDVMELIRANPDETASIRRHLEQVHADYASRFDRISEQSRDPRA